jgi:hypothetical protein
MEGVHGIRVVEVKAKDGCEHYLNKNELLRK